MSDKKYKFRGGMPVSSAFTEAFLPILAIIAILMGMVFPAVRYLQHLWHALLR
jgi:hypothetical protein